MLIKELVTRLGFDVNFAPLEKFDDKIGETKEGLQDMGAAADEAVEQVKSALTTIRNTLIGFTIATAAGAAGLFALVKSAANVGDEVNKTAPLLGFTREEFQKYRYAAKLAGVENENFAQSTQLLLRNISDAVAGNKEIGKSFGKLGLDPAALKQMSTAEVLRQMSDRLATIPSEADRVALSMDLMGRSGARMGAFLAQGTSKMDELMADVEAFGMFTEDSAQAAEDFNDSLDRVIFFIAGIKNEIAHGLFPVFQGMLDDIREWLSLNREAIRENIAKGVQLLTTALTKAWDVAKKVVGFFETMISALGGLDNAFRLLGVAILAPIMLILGPITALTRGIAALLVPFLRLHTLIVLVTFAMSTMMPIITLMTSVVAALAATKIVAWLVAMAGGWRAVASAMLIPLLEFAAMAALISAAILVGEDLYTWFNGGKSVIGEWVKSWARLPDTIRKIWDDIKAVFRAGGDFIAAVFSGNFSEAFRILKAGGEAVKDAVGSAMPQGQGPTGPFKPMQFSGSSGGFGMFSPMQYAMAGSPSAAPMSPSQIWERGGSVSVGDLLSWDGKTPFRPGGAPAGAQAAGAGQGTASVVQHNNFKMDLVLPRGTPQEQAKEVAAAVRAELDREIDHSLQQSVAPGK